MSQQDQQCASHKSIQDALVSYMNLEKDQEHSIIKVFIGFPSGKIIEHDSFESVEHRLFTAVAKKKIQRGSICDCVTRWY